MTLGKALSLAAMCAFATNADSPRLNRYLAKLRDKPQNLELREKIISLALAMNPRPPAPAEAEELEGWAAAALKDAKTPSDYLAAAQAYQKALLLAPWVAEDYLGLAAAQEKAGQYQEAAASLRLYLLAAPRAKEVRGKIGALKYRIEKSASGQIPNARGPAPAGAAADMAARLKSLASGSYGQAYECGRDNPLQALRKREVMGCSKEEYAGDHWHKVALSATHEIHFQKDGTIELLAVGGFSKSVELLGRPKGPTFKDIDWLRCNERGACGKPVWVELSDDLGAITVSFTRPVDEAEFDPKASYPYVRYRR